MKQYWTLTNVFPCWKTKINTAFHKYEPKLSKWWWINSPRFSSAHSDLNLNVYHLHACFSHVDYEQSDRKQSVLVHCPQLSRPHNWGSTALVQTTTKQSLTHGWSLTGTQRSHHSCDDLANTSSALELLLLRCSKVLLNTQSQEILVIHCSISPKAELGRRLNFSWLGAVNAYSYSTLNFGLPISPYHVTLNFLAQESQLAKYAEYYSKSYSSHELFFS